MLHPVNRPDCIDALWLAVYIQEELLKLSLTKDPLDIRNLNSVFGRDTVSWLWKYKQKLIDPLTNFYNHTNSTQKNDILLAFRHDINYYKQYSDRTFTFYLQPKANLPSPLAAQVGGWFENFYDVITQKGFPASVSGYRCDINAQVINAETLSKNDGLYVCPVCDGTWMERTSTGILGSIDHFLPRSIYPALSVHPYNLLPICTTCNEKIKKDNDPLTYLHQRKLSETFHSYIQPARDSVQVQIGSSWNIVDKGVYPKNQLLIFPDIFDLPGRWQQDADEFDRSVRRRIRDSVDAKKDEIQKIDQSAFDRILLRLDQRLCDEWGGVGNSYPATWYFRWLCQNKKAELLLDYVG